MKKINNIVVACAVILLISGFAACKKKDVATRDKVTGKWWVSKREVKTINNDQPTVFDYPVTPADYFSFKADNQYINSFDGVVSSGTYHIIDDQSIVINQDTASILNLTDKVFHLKWRTVGADQIREITLHLKK